MTGYIPAEDSAALAWMTTFGSGIAANFALYGLSSADSIAINNAISLFAASLPPTQNPATRTKVTVATKDDARTAAEQICRQFAIDIKYSAAVSEPDKIAIGIRPPNNSRDPIEAPGTEPILNVVGTAFRTHTLRFADIETPTKAAKPFGAGSLQLFVALGDEPTNDPKQATFVGAVTRNPVGVAFEAADDGKVASYFARWASVRGEVGPWSAGISRNVAA